VKYRKLPTFDADFRKLSEKEHEAFRTFVRDLFIPAVKGFEKDPKHYSWPRSLRFEHLTGTKGILVVTWSFSGPDGRATFEFEVVDGETYLVWRRVGLHSIYRRP
jgi:hypothetical protein